MSANTGVIATAEVTAVVGDRRKEKRERGWQKQAVLYSWTFDELHEVLEAKDKLALVLERSFSSDLQRKMRKHDTKIKYKYVLLGAMSNLSDEISPVTGRREEKLDANTRAFVRRIREEMSVSEPLHRTVCQELALSEKIFTEFTVVEGSEDIAVPIMESLKAQQIQRKQKQKQSQNQLNKNKNNLLNNNIKGSSSVIKGSASKKQVVVATSTADGQGQVCE